jgi:hypothetical protein
VPVPHWRIHFPLFVASIPVLRGLISMSVGYCHFI